MAETSVVWRCTAQRQDGAFCDSPSVRDAPFPICGHHAVKLFTFMRDLVPQFEVVPDASRPRATPRVRAKQNGAPVVYYLRVGSLIKIGYTTDLTARLRTYPPNAVMLATEPGGKGQEFLRLRQFRHLLSNGREWFVEAPDLLAHIEGLAA